MGSLAELARTLERLEGKGYPSYKSIRGAWVGDGMTLHVDHVQGDPFATPSSLRWRIPHDTHGVPERFRSTPAARIGLADLLLERFAARARKIRPIGGSGKSGRIQVDVGRAEILERSGCVVTDTAIELRFRVGLPARGRRVLGHAAAALLTEELPWAAEIVSFDALDPADVEEQVRLVEDHERLQAELRERGLVAFVRDGAVLPRESGASWRPLEGAVPFESPPELRVALPTTHHGVVEGMGVPQGVTLLVGGGFHGKTTLLEALQRGVYPHVPGDGREWVVTAPDAVKVRSEDGRSVCGVDLRPFIGALPRGRTTERFETPDASGSTSLAAAILEALELGARVLLLDEDTCATNLLVRDARMQALVESEPIVPLIDRVAELHRDHGVSTVLALGASGDYLEVADTVIRMDAYRPAMVTDQARAVAKRIPTQREPTHERAPFRFAARRPRASSFDAGPKDRVRSRGTKELRLGDEEVELGAVEQIVDPSQLRLIGAMLREAGRLADSERSVPELVDALTDRLAREGVLAFGDRPELAVPRRYEVGAAINRLRRLALA